MKCVRSSLPTQRGIYLRDAVDTSAVQEFAVTVQPLFGEQGQSPLPLPLPPLPSLILFPPLQKRQTALTSSVFFVFRAGIRSLDVPPLSFSIISHARLWLKSIPLNYLPINYTTLRYPLYPSFFPFIRPFPDRIIRCRIPLSRSDRQNSCYDNEATRGCHIQSIQQSFFILS